MTVASRSAASAAALVACDRITVLVFLPPKLDFIFFSTLYSSLAHLDIVLYLGFGKLSVLPEDDVEAQSENAEAYKY